jgi:hypothetical protein
LSSLIDINMETLRRYRQDIYENVKRRIREQPDTGLSVAIAANGSPNLYNKHTDEYVYSKYSPEHESARWAESLSLDAHHATDVILFGVGLTHHLAAFLTVYPNHQVYLYEPDLDIFIQSLHVINLQDLLSNVNVRYLSVGESIEEQSSLFYRYYTYSQMMGGAVAVPFYEKSMKKKVQDFAINMKRYLIDFESSKQYSERIGKYEQHNLLSNLGKVLSSPSLAQLRNHWSGKRAIIVGGGPSLEKDLPLLRELKDLYLIIAAGTSIQALLNYNIKPHLVVSMDAFAINYNAFSKIKMEEQPFLFVPTIESRILDLPGALLIHAFLEHNEQYVELFDLKKAESPLFIGTHSVTGTAIQAAAYMGIETILFTGQDLSFPDKKMYSAGVNHHNARQTDHISKQMTEQVENVVGGYNATTAKMKMTLHDIENLIQKMQNVTFYNCSQGGAAIKGALYKPLGDIEHPGHNYSREQFVEEISTLIQGYSNEELDSVKTKLAGQKRWLEQLPSTIVEIQKSLSKLELLSRSHPGKCLKTITFIEEVWGGIVQHNYFKFLIEPVLKNVMLDFDKVIPHIQNEQKLIEKTKLLKEALQPVLVAINDWFQQMIPQYEKTLSSL